MLPQTMPTLGTRLLAMMLMVLVSFVSNGSLLAQELKVRTIGFAPYGFTENDNPTGIYYDAANLLLKHSGLTGQNSVAPYSRIRAELISGICDMTIMFKYPELEPYVHYIAPLPPLKVVVIGLAGSSFPSVPSLKGKRIAYLRGASFSAEIDGDEDIKITRVTDLHQGVKMLTVGHVDAVIGPLDPIYRAALKLSKGPDMFGEPLIVSVRTPWVQVSKQSSKEIPLAKLKEAYARLDQEGVFQLLREKYLLLKNDSP
mgnify:CR=1 FL=1